MPSVTMSTPSSSPSPSPLTVSPSSTCGRRSPSCSPVRVSSSSRRRTSPPITPRIKDVHVTSASVVSTTSTPICRVASSTTKTISKGFSVRDILDKPNSNLDKERSRSPASKSKSSHVNKLCSSHHRSRDHHPMSAAETVAAAAAAGLLTSDATGSLYPPSSLYYSIPHEGYPHRWLPPMPPTTSDPVFPYSSAFRKFDILIIWTICSLKALFH